VSTPQARRGRALPCDAVSDQGGALRIHQPVPGTRHPLWKQATRQPNDPCEPQWTAPGGSRCSGCCCHSWHWTGTGLVGQGANSVLFGRRTEHGGPYRNLHLLVGGDVIYIYTSDGRRYTYQVVASFITSKYSNEIMWATRKVGGEAVSLVACSKTSRLPTSLEHRLVVTGQFVRWDDLG
jgi:Sortase domain